MKKRLMYLTLAVIALASCNSGYKTGENGVVYQIYTSKTGPKIKEGDFLTINIIVRNEAGVIVSRPYDPERPKPWILPKPQFKGDFIDGIKLLTEGDSASFKMPTDSMFKKGPKPALLKGAFATYTVIIRKVIPRGNLDPQAFQAAIDKFMASQVAVIKNAEPARIKKYIADKKLNVTKTDSGLYYVITKQGSGPQPVAGDTVVVEYTGYLLNGKMFDTNVEKDAVSGHIVNKNRQYAPIGFPIGQKKVIAGWDQGLLLLTKATRATFIIPSNLAYGENGYGMIPPFTPLVYDMWVADILHPKPAKK